MTRTEYDFYQSANRRTLEKSFKHLGSDEVRQAKETWLIVETFEDFFRLIITLDNLPVSKQDTIGLHFYFLKHSNPSGHDLLICINE